MNKKILHITNGDKTTISLKSFGFKGKFITWREILGEGKTSPDIGSEDFWKTRFNFLKSSYKITKKTFIDYTLKEYRNLCVNKNQEEIILWFDYDLLSQINLIAIISWLKRYRNNEKISLVNVNNPKLVTLKKISDLNGNQVNRLYYKRIELTTNDIEYADYMWQLYCSNCPLRLEAIYKYNPMSPFIYLSKAFEMHLKRFPSVENGLNFLENKIVNLASEKSLISKKQLVQKLSKNHESYGLQEHHFNYKIERLKILFKSFNPLVINSFGKKVLDNKQNVYKQLRCENAYLGGVKQYNYLFQNSSTKLLKISF